MSGEKTLDPTQNKLKEERKKGNVATSKDVKIVFIMIAFYSVFFWAIGHYLEWFIGLFEEITKEGFGSKWRLSPDVFSAALDVFLWLCIPLVLLCGLVGSVATWLQMGFIVAPEAAKPSFKKFDFVQNIKNMFSKKSLVQILLSLFKVLILAWLGYLVFMDAAREITLSYRHGFSDAMRILGDVLERIIYLSLSVFVALSIIDWFMERMHYLKNLRMSHQDVMDEYKKTEGNPMTKQRLKSESRSILNSSLNRIGDAKAVVANPTHISVALDYEPGKHDLPYILAMGEDEDALQIRQEAARLGIPVIVNVQLARMLYRDCQVDEYIKKQHLKLAAEVFKAVFEMMANHKKTSINSNAGSGDRSDQ